MAISHSVFPTKFPRNQSEFMTTISGTHTAKWRQSTNVLLQCIYLNLLIFEALHSVKQKIHFHCAFTHDWWRRAAGSEGWPEEGRKRWGGRRTRSPTPRQSLCRGVSAGTCCWWTWNRKHESTCYITVTIWLLTRDNLVEINLAHTWFESTLISKSTYVYVQKFCKELNAI